MGILLAFGLIGALFASQYLTGFAGSDRDLEGFFRRLAVRAALERAAFLGDGGRSERRFVVIRDGGPRGSFSALPMRFSSVDEAEHAVKDMGNGAAKIPSSGVQYHVFDVGVPILVMNEPEKTTRPVSTMFMNT